MLHILTPMKAFNGRAATEEYMSTHSLTFSTPEMTLKKFVSWLGEPVPSPKTKENVPRLMLYLEEKDSDSKAAKLSNLMPDTDDTFRPSGAVMDMYSHEESGNRSTNDIKKVSASSGTRESENKSCFQCGSQLKPDSKFCRSCGTRQDANHRKSMSI
jgi:ribosomal protein L40E